MANNAGPSGDDLFTHYKVLAKAPMRETFDNTFENEVTVFLNNYDTKSGNKPIHDELEFDILNGNITY